MSSDYKPHSELAALWLWISSVFLLCLWITTPPWCFAAGLCLFSPWNKLPRAQNHPPHTHPDRTMAPLIGMGWHPVLLICVPLAFGGIDNFLWVTVYLFSGELSSQVFCSLKFCCYCWVCAHHIIWTLVPSPILTCKHLLLFCRLPLDSVGRVDIQRFLWIEKKPSTLPGPLSLCGLCPTDKPLSNPISGNFPIIFF